MKYVELKAFTEENGARPIYLFEGEETYFRQRGEELLKGKFVQEPTLDYVAFDGSALKGEKMLAIADALRAFPFISQKRMVRVNEFYPTDKDFESYLAPLFDAPPADSILLIVNTAKAKTGQCNLAKQKNVTVVDCARSDLETIKKWIYLTCKRAGVYADGVVCSKIAEYCVLDMARIAMETDKLLTYCTAKGVNKLTDALVDDLVYPDSDYKIFELANALARKNYSAFMKISRDLSTQGFNETALLSALVSYFKGLYETSCCKGSDKDVAVALGIKEFAARKNREQAARFEKGALLACYEAVFAAISAVKCGKWTPEGAWKAVIARLFFENGEK